VKPEAKLYVTKKDYGKAPKYLEKIKGEIDEEYKIVKEMQQQEEEMKEREKFLIPDEERKQLIDALKKKWELLHHDYQAIITRVTKVNPLGLKVEKERLEKEMEQVEKDINKLSKNFIFVDANQ
jgi:hypothetical protein